VPSFSTLAFGAFSPLAAIASSQSYTATTYQSDASTELNSGSAPASGK